MLKDKIIKNILVTIIITIISLSLTGCSKKQNDENMANEKLDSELQYLDTKLISLMNVLNNISFTNYKVVAENVKQEESKDSGSSDNKSSKEGQSESQGGGKSSSSSNSESGSSNSNSSSSSESSSGSQSGANGGGESQNKSEEQNQLYSLTENNILSLDSSSNIKWDYIKSEVESLYSIWTTIVIDLHTAKVNSDDILRFNTLLDSLAKSAKEENKEQSLNNLSELYSLLPKYLNSYSEDDIKKSVYNTKSYLLKAYSMADSENKWEEMNEEISKANQEFSNIINSVNIDENKKLNVNRAYLLLRETKSSIEDRDKEVFFLKYKNTIQELNML